MRHLPIAIVCLTVTLLLPANLSADPAPARETSSDTWLTIWEGWPDLWPSGMAATSETRHDRNGSTPQLMLIRQETGTVSADLDHGPDIAMPGPDMGDFPNSAYTLPQGRIQFETGPVSFSTKNSNNPAAYASPFLFRYGVTDDVEFRVLGTGITLLDSPYDTWGFGVLTFDTKIHLWDDQMERLIPAVSFEAALQTELGSSVFRAGTQPSLNINMDFPFTSQTNFEATVGYGGSLTSVNVVTLSNGVPEDLQIDENIYLFSFQAALEQELAENLSGFVHGSYSQPVGVSGEAGVVLGAGFFYQISTQVMTFGSANAGLTDVPAPFSTQLGIAYAY